MRRFLRQILSSEEGLVLPSVLALLALGGLIIIPVLNHTTTGLRTLRMYDTKTLEFTNADSGMEHAYWRLINDSAFVESMTEQHPTEEYSINLNNQEVSVTVTRIAGMAGDTLTMEDVDYIIPSGHQLELRIVVSDDDHMHFAYDTESYKAWLQMPVASGNPTYYLHNNPTPPTGDTDAQADLEMDEDEPAGTAFYNYDQNYDSNPGRRIEESDGGPDGLELKEYQNWLTDPYSEDTHFQGTVITNLFIAPDGFNFDNDGEFTMYLRDYDPVGDTYDEINSSTYTIEEGEWVQMWQPTAAEGKYKIITTSSETQLRALVALGFGYIRTEYFINTSVGG